MKNPRRIPASILRLPFEMRYVILSALAEALFARGLDVLTIFRWVADKLGTRTIPITLGFLALAEKKTALRDSLIGGAPRQSRFSLF